MTEPAESNPSASRSRVRVHEQDGVVRLSLVQERADGTAVRELYETTAALSERRNVRLLVDLGGVPMVNSGMLGILVAMKKLLLHAGGQLHIAVPDPRVMEQFRVAKLHLVLNLFGSVSEASAAFR